MTQNTIVKVIATVSFYGPLSFHIQWVLDVCASIPFILQSQHSNLNGASKHCFRKFTLHEKRFPTQAAQSPCMLNYYLIKLWTGERGGAKAKYLQ